MAIAAPKISAKAVLTDASIAVKIIILPTVLLHYSKVVKSRLFPPLLGE